MIYLQLLTLASVLVLIALHFYDQSARDRAEMQHRILEDKIQNHLDRLEREAKK